MHLFFKSACLLIILSVCCIRCFTQDKHSSEVNKIVKAIEASNVYEMSYSVGFTGSISKQYQRFEQLVKTATDKELTDLVENYPNAVVRLYAWQALKKHQTPVEEALTKKLNVDRDEVTTLYGCIAKKRKVNELVNVPVFTIMPAPSNKHQQ